MEGKEGFIFENIENLRKKSAFSLDDKKSYHKKKIQKVLVKIRYKKQSLVNESI